MTKLPIRQFGTSPDPSVYKSLLTFLRLPKGTLMFAIRPINAADPGGVVGIGGTSSNTIPNPTRAIWCHYNGTNYSFNVPSGETSVTLNGGGVAQDTNAIFALTWQENETAKLYRRNAAGFTLLAEAAIGAIKYDFPVQNVDDDGVKTSVLYVGQDFSANNVTAFIGIGAPLHNAPIVDFRVWGQKELESVTKAWLDDFAVAVGLAPQIVNQRPFAAFSVSTNNLTATFDASSSLDPEGQPLTYAWDFGDGTTGTGVTPSRTYAAAGAYTVKLTIKDAGGLTDTTTKSVTVSVAKGYSVFRLYIDANQSDNSFGGTRELELKDPSGGIIDLSGATLVTPTELSVRAGQASIELRDGSYADGNGLVVENIGSVAHYIEVRLGTKRQVGSITFGAYPTTTGTLGRSIKDFRWTAFNDAGSEVLLLDQNDIAAWTSGTQARTFTTPLEPVTPAPAPSLAVAYGYGEYAIDPTATYTDVLVTTTADSGAGSLREALTTLGAHRVRIDPALQGGTIRNLSQIIVKGKKDVDFENIVSVGGYRFFIGAESGATHVAIRNVKLGVSTNRFDVHDAIMVEQGTPDLHVWFDGIYSDQPNADGLIDIIGNYNVSKDDTLPVLPGKVYATLSRMDINQGYKEFLVGTNETDRSAVNLYITWYYNHIFETTYRLPMIRRGTLHAFNCIWESWGESATSSQDSVIRVISGAKVLVEHNEFDPLNWFDVIKQGDGSLEPGGYVRAINNRLLNNAVLQEASPSLVPDPVYKRDYTEILLPADANMKTAVLNAIAGGISTAFNVQITSSTTDTNTAAYTLTGTVTETPATLSWRQNGGAWQSLTPGTTFSVAVTLTAGANTLDVRGTLANGTTDIATITKTLTVASATAVHHRAGTGAVFSSGTATSVSSTIPSTTMAGDSILLFVFGRSTLTTPTGYTKILEQTATVSPTTQRLAVYRKVAAGTAGATSTDAGKTITVTQAAGGRMGIEIGVAYASSGTISVENFVQAEWPVGADVTNSNRPGLHPVQGATSGGADRLAYIVSSCIYAANELRVYSPPTGWNSIGPAQHVDHRLSVAYQSVNAVTLSGTWSHDTAPHKGLEAALILRAA